MKKIYQQLFAGILLSTLSGLSIAAETDPLVGKWKTVDDRTGYSRADVEIRKKADGSYEGIIVTTRNVPGTVSREDKLVRRWQASCSWH